MSQKKKKDDISRRDFIKGVGAGVVGSGILAAGDTALSQEKGTAARAGKSGGKKVSLAFEVNGKPVEVRVSPETTLVEVLRDELDLPGTKVACNRGECGTCTVLLDKRAVYSCHMLALDAAGRKVVTIEGLLEEGRLHPIQEAFIEHDGFQCGFCTSGQIMAAQALLLKTPRPTREQVLEGMSGNICRCSGYPHIIESVLKAAEKSGR